MEDMILKIDINIICGIESRTKAWVLLMKRKRVLRQTDLTEPFQGAFIKEKKRTNWTKPDVEGRRGG